VSTLTLLSGLSLVGCGPTIPENLKVHRAPASVAETGSVIVGPSESDMAKILSSDSRLTVRVVNQTHNIYEVYGAKTEELNKLIDQQSSILSVDRNQVIVEKNAFINLKDQAPATPQADTSNKNPLVSAIEENQGVKLSGAALDFVNSCKLNRLVSPEPTVKDNQGRDKQNAGIYFELGKTLTLDGSATKAKGFSKKISLLWVVSPSEDSAMAPVIAQGNTVSVTPDATGLQIYSVIAKDENGFCGIDMKPFYVTANDRFAPKDPMDDSWASRIDEKTFWHVFHVGSHDGWSQATGEGMTVAIIDTGVNYNHPALALNVRVNQNEIPENQVDDDKNGFIDDVTGYDFGNDDAYPFDDYGHGSHVAGIAASPVFGAARKAKILPVKFGAGVGFDIASVIGAIHYSVDAGAKVLNMSFGWPEDLAAVREAINYTEKKNVLVVVAAGNDSKPGTIANNDVTPSYPCNYPNSNLISVAATDEKDVPTFYSNLGVKTVHLAAPGGTPELPIISTYKKNPKDAQFVGLMGTSMATPLVVGVAAQVWSAKPSMTAAQVKNLLMRTGKKSPALQGKIASGAVVDAQAALAAVATTTRLQ
jgi:subtilisin family serine protease